MMKGWVESQEDTGHLLVLPNEITLLSCFISWLLHYLCFVCIKKIRKRSQNQDYTYIHVHMFNAYYALSRGSKEAFFVCMLILKFV